MKSAGDKVFQLARGRDNTNCMWINMFAEFQELKLLDKLDFTFTTEILPHSYHYFYASYELNLARRTKIQEPLQAWSVKAFPHLSFFFY